jgi:hypothetical protein
LHLEKNSMTKAFLVLALTVLALACKKDDRSFPAATFSVAFENTADLKAGKAWKFFNVLLPDTTILAPVNGAQQSWEYRDLQQTSEFTAYYQTPATNPDFTSATFTKNMIDSFGSGSKSAASDSKYYIQNTAEGLSVLGKTIEQVTLNYDSVSSITYPTQSIVYSNKIVEAKYPLKLNESWSGSNIIANYNFTANFPRAGISNINGKQVSTMSYNNTVIASGYMNLKGYDGSIPVLVVRRQVGNRTNYFLNGVAAPAALLSSAGLSDGAVTTTVSYDFFSPVVGYVGTLYMNNTNTQVKRAVIRKSF